MTPLKTRPALLPSIPGALGGPIAHPRAWRSAPAPLRAFGPLARVWYACRARWLGTRLRKVETELQQFMLRKPRDSGEGDAPISREDRAAYESCCLQSALLRARIDWFRTLA
ncbi:MAG: hypothetical protein K8R60_19295 [Burkholderiales bacterium]|nr:hypothetical protein [Burkholderiales bacterium]